MLKPRHTIIAGQARIYDAKYTSHQLDLLPVTSGIIYDFIVL